MHNLIKNAQEAMPVDQSVRIRVTSCLAPQTDPQMVAIRLSDNGPGIPTDQVERIFEPYVTHKTKGTGLGLAIVRRIIEETGGTIKVDPQYTGGASFLLTLPVASMQDSTSP